MRDALRELCAGREDFPSQREFRAAGLGGLYDALQTRGELDRWAARLGLPRRRRGHGGGPPVHWTDERIAAVLQELCAGRTHFPTEGEFEQAGRGGLYQALKGRRELDAWAARIGLPRRGRGGTAKWTDETILAALTPLCAGRERFPTITEFQEAGLGGLHSTLGRRRGLDAWAARFGLPRHPPNGRLPTWTPATISAALDGLCAGRETFPSHQDFKAAGLLGLYQALYRRGEFDAWVARSGLPRQRST